MHTPIRNQTTRVNGRAELVVTAGDARGGETAKLSHLFHRQPLRLFFPHPSRRSAFAAVLGNVSGGMVGGDQYAVSVKLEEGAKMLFTAQAAEKIYRTAGAETRVDTDIHVGEDAALYWLPQGTILFDGCRLRRMSQYHLAPDARMLAGEIVMFGRTAMGEELGRGLFHDDWRIRVAGRLVWADAFHMDGDLAATLAHPATLDEARAMASCVYVAKDAADHLSQAREILGDGEVTAAATAFDGLLLIRWMARDAAALRRSFGNFWCGFCREIGEDSANPPSIWHI